MILKSVKIENYKCIEDSTQFTVGPVTCLVGKNESGKSALLQALHKLNSVEGDLGYDVTSEYPRRHLSEYEARHATNPDNILTTEWELSKPDIEAAEAAFGPKCIKAPEITIVKGYDNLARWQFEHDEQQVISHFISRVKLDKPEQETLSAVESIQQLAQTLEAKEKEQKSEQRQILLTLLKKTFPKGDLRSALDEWLRGLLPKFIYFPQYGRLPGRVNIDELIPKGNNTSFEEKLFLALLQLAGTTAQEIRNQETIEHLIAKLEGVSNLITKEIFTYWSQNRHLKVQFDLRQALAKDEKPGNYIFMTRIENTRHSVTVGFDERSSGFVWFFSFLVWFSQMKRNYGERLVLLLDEPGLSLHAKAQADLLRYFREKLKPHYQLLYTTHSPFMVDPEDLLGARTVEDASKNDEVLGTKVGDKVLSTDTDTIFPLQAALGFDITQTLFVGEHTLLVEGPSDLLYLRWVSRQLAQQNRTALDRRWVICPSGGIDKIASFVALFGGNKLHVAVLADFHRGLKTKVRNLVESKLLLDGHVFSADSYAGKTEADIEDMLGRDFYVELVNSCYGLPAKQALPQQQPADAPIRVLEEVERHFAVLTGSVPEFDHYTPAYVLTEKNAPSPSDDLLDRFEKLFKDLNSLLPGASPQVTTPRIQGIERLQRLQTQSEKEPTGS